jgi:hypothetical protein
MRRSLPGGTPQAMDPKTVHAMGGGQGQYL